MSRFYPRDHPLFFHALVGASAWAPKGALKPTRLYINHYRYRGWEWWESMLAEKKAWIAKWGEFHPGLTDEHLEYMPEGYWDLEQSRWFVSPKAKGAWSDDFYDGFMRAALKRRTLAPMYAPREVKTVNGRILERGMLCTYIGGEVLRRPHYDMSANIGMTVIAVWREAGWHYKNEKGLQTSYGTGEVKLREYGHCKAPYAWWIVPAEEDREFLIPGRNFDTTHSILPIENPQVSLLALDDSGSQALRRILPTPEKEIAWR